MTKNNDSTKQPGLEFEKMMKSTSEMWKKMGDAWQSMIPGAQSSADTHFNTESMKQSWETFSEMFSASDLLKNIFEAGGADTDESMKQFYQMYEERVKAAHQSMTDAAEKMSGRFSDFKFDQFDKDAFHKWSEIYQEEIQRFFNIPQVGLGREYQERMGKAMDKYNLLNASVLEFLYFLYIPMEQSFKNIQQEIVQLAKDGKLPDDTQAYYNDWLKELEKHYMTMFQSQEYVNVMGRALEALGEFRMAKNAIIEDVLNSAPIPTQTEMDELYKEIYLLKKKVKSMEKKIKTSGVSASAA